MHSSLSLFNHGKHVVVQTIILCVNSPFVSSSVIVAQLIIFLLRKLSVLRGNLSNSNKLENEFLVPKILLQGRKVDAI